MKRVAVVFGGRSTEHEISCVSAGSVLGSIDRDRYDVVAIGITRDGRWMLSSDNPDAYAIEGHTLPAVPASGTVVTFPADPVAKPLVIKEQAFSGELGQVDVVFPLLHGPYGEDGTIQGLLELAGVPYVGSGVLASALAMDKEFMKVVLGAAGLPVPRYAVVRDGRSPLADESVGFPCFVKPARGGSSVGISRVERAEELPDALAQAHQHDPKALIEEAVVGREIECGVLQDETGAPMASLPAEIHVSGHDFYDFAAKYYSDAGTQFDVPAELPDGVTAEVQRLACAAFTALGCEGLARVDFFLTEDRGLLINEVNTMPGFTPASMFPRMWAASGIDYPELVDRLIDNALSRRPGLR